MPSNGSADQFLKRLKILRLPGVAKSNSHLAADADDVVLGVPMGKVFALAKELMDMPLDEVEIMLESPIHEMRVGAVSIMDFQARSKKTLTSVEKSCSTCISAGTTASTPGIWWTDPLRGWWGVT